MLLVNNLTRGPQINPFLPTQQFVLKWNLTLAVWVRLILIQLGQNELFFSYGTPSMLIQTSEDSCSEEIILCLTFHEQG